MPDHVCKLPVHSILLGCFLESRANAFQAPRAFPLQTQDGKYSWTERRTRGVVQRDPASQREHRSYQFAGLVSYDR